ncbi:MAG: hypothetical protein HN509_09690 [Halobacteriovoraceae bacterium]|jgi:hypothetical protein|nr:hypothetical protein [Halobacteriovoraceae bacterium]MBT5094787.1 hypothetical protein [Halobacteriovoraceae bacterium]
MKTRLLLFVLFTMSFSALSANKFIQGEGKFLAKSEDSLSFVKTQLLARSIQDILTKEMTSMGLDTAFFWEKYNEKFENYFSPIQENLKTKYKIGTPKVTKYLTESYAKAVRTKRLKLNAKYGRLNRVITSYSIKNVSTSMNVPNSRFMKIQAKVNRKQLYKIFRRFTSHEDQRTYKKLFVTLDFNLNNTTWNDVGVEVESDFSSVVLNHWKKLLEEKLKGIVEEVEITDLSTRESLQDFYKAPVEAFTGVDTENSSSDESELSQSLWLRVKTNIHKTAEDVLLKNRKFRVGGDFILLDLRNKKLVAFHDFIEETPRFNYEKSHKLSSDLATLVYRLPTAEFNKLDKTVSRLPKRNHYIYLNLKNLNNIAEVFAIKELLINKGFSYNFQPVIQSFTGTEGKITLNFRGSGEQVQQVLWSLQESRINKEKIITFESSENPFSITLVEKVLEEAKEEQVIKKDRLKPKERKSPKRIDKISPKGKEKTEFI